MVVIRWLRLVVVAPVLAVLLTVATTGLMLPVLAMALNQHVFMGFLIGWVPIAWLCASVMAVRRLTLLSNRGAAVPHDDQVRAVAAACRAAGVPVPTCFVVQRGPDRPVTLRGLRRLHVLARAEVYARPDLVAEAVRQDLRSGDAWLLPLFSTICSAFHDWSAALRRSRTWLLGVTSMEVWLFYWVPWALALPVLLPGWAVAWVTVHVAKLLVPRRFVRDLLLVFGTNEDVRPLMIEQPRFGYRLGLPVRVPMTSDLVPREECGPPRLRTRWNTPTALGSGFRWSMLFSAMTLITNMLLVTGASYAGVGMFPAQRVVWPHEERVTITVEQVQVDDQSQNSVMGRAGYDIGSTYWPRGVADDGRRAVLAYGSTPVHPGDVVVAAADRERLAEGNVVFARSLTQDQLLDILVTSLIVLGFALGVSRILRGLFNLEVIDGSARLSPVREIAVREYDQKVAIGARVRGRRPKQASFRVT
ncbi:hypothetical protein [Cellulomonas bogoriensis]|uniref:Uncharacterized protein n=1 Tax=Cellulomonas bogoriensis 69B4 = DSM 16987 TaxID=1386082 RepID=A0A0A0C337_9CELL|nr:hypothetical protein [Cellulomonas bogoriensis]KGM14591.1 hypothetical protein N869_05165 [Cellulomonas bogoriensis 69B4 = DSM 16987]